MAEASFEHLMVKTITNELGLERGQDYELAAVLDEGECRVALALTSCSGRALVEDLFELLRTSRGAKLGDNAVSTIRVTNAIPLPQGNDRTAELRRLYTVNGNVPCILPFTLHF